MKYSIARVDMGLEGVLKVSDQVHELDEELKSISEYCKSRGINPHYNVTYKMLVNEGIKKYTKYGYVYNGVCFVYRKANNEKRWR